ncbi:MAG TPA: Calx-beta domain-containing protein, partial [Woeseiaceae bacterium]|nr:Calx-beta domain-containing protein [Woeseiaceae bacterium]
MFSNSKNVVAVIFLILTSNALAQTGIMPIPQTDQAIVDVSVDIVPATGTQPTQYIYRYSLTNPASSTSGIYKFSVDVSGQGRSFLRPILQTVPKQGGALTRPIEEEIDLFFPFLGSQGDGVVPIGLECPSGWNGGLRKDATAVCYTANETPEIGPGETLAGFAIHSRLPPMLRNVSTAPFWTVVVDNHEDAVDREAAFDVLENLQQAQTSIGPGYIYPAERRHYTTFEKDVAEMVDMGWVPDAVLAQEIIAIVDDAGELFNSAQGSAAKLRLNDLIDAIDSAPSGAILTTAVEHLVTSVDSIQQFGSNTFPTGGLDKQYRAIPLSADMKVGDTFEMEVFVFRLNNYDFENGVFEDPVVGDTVYFQCDPFSPDPDPCPNFPSQNSSIPVTTGPGGIARFSYTGSVVGTDTFVLCGYSFCEGEEARVTVDWTSDVDLVVEAFSPPLIKAATGELIQFIDRTANYGDALSGESVTRYYISSSPNPDPATANVVGDRAIPVLQSGEVSESGVVQFPLPPGFSLDFHYLIACADAEDVVVESDETNNCSTADLEGIEHIAIAVADFDDLMALAATDVSIEEGDSGISQVAIPVDLGQRNPSADIVVAYETTDGTASASDGDYVATSGQIVFPAGTGSMSQSIVVDVVGDTLIESDESLSVVLSVESGGALIADPEV